MVFKYKNYMLIHSSNMGQVFECQYGGSVHYVFKFTRELFQLCVRDEAEDRVFQDVGVKETYQNHSLGFLFEMATAKFYLSFYPKSY